MSIGPMILEVSKPIPWDLEDGITKKGFVRQLVVYCSVRKRNYVISENTVLRETLVFPSDSRGEFESLREVAGGKGMTLEDVLEEWTDGTLYFMEDSV